MVRTRFGPSPTGELHIGGLRTALFNWLFARKAGGAVVLRMEDTDRARSRPEFERSIMDDLVWAGLGWDEGPVRQSERAGMYREFGERLLSSGAAFRCYCTEERLAHLRVEQRRNGLPPRYDGACRGLKTPPAGVEPAVRFRVPEKKVRFCDMVHGPMEFDTGAFGDFVIIGSDGMASYNFACALDDSLMGITHVIRGDDHLSNTPRQILVLESLGLDVPEYAHLPLVLDADGTPLSKRHGHASISVLREEGYLPLAVVNAAARLGWSPGKVEGGLMALDELTGAFDPSRLSKSPSVYDTGRLRAFNREALASLAAGEIVSLLGAGDERTVEAVRGSAFTLNEIRGLLAPFISAPEPTDEAREALDKPGAAGVLSAFADEAERAGTLDHETYKEVVARTGKRSGAKGKALFLPLRCALTGRTDGIELERVVEILGRDEVLRRVRRALKRG